jgi:HEXXH motif-containing protein
MLHDSQNPFADLVACVAAPGGSPSAVDLLETLAVDHSRRMLSAFVREAPLRVHLPAGLLETLSLHAERLQSFEHVWRPSFGALFHVQRTCDPAFLCGAAVEIAIQAHAFGIPGSWSVQFPRPARVVTGPRSVEGVVEAAGGHANGRGHVSLTLQTGEIESAEIEPLPHAWHSGKREPSVTTFGYRTDEDAIDGASTVEPESARHLRNGLRLLDESSPDYAVWVRGAVRYVAPLVRQGTNVASWSSLHYPSLVSQTLFDSPLDMAETLVHEASHQRYHLLDSVMPLLKPGGDQEMYWSPIKQCLRPLPMLLLAFHAFGNIALLFHDLRRHEGLDESAFAYHMSDLRAWLPPMAETLERARRLTAEGSALWSQLYERAEIALFARAGAEL